MIQWLNHTSLAIKGFPMGDPHERCFPVYLPPDYNAKRSEPYPVIYMLAGFGSRGADYLQEKSVYSPPLAARLDNLIKEKKMPGAIVVFPDGSSKLGCSQYINSIALGNYMDYLADELTQFIDDNFNTHSDAAYRGLIGHSSGGFGSLVTGMMRPDKFQFINSSAGDSFYEAWYLSAMINTINELDRIGAPAAFVEWFLAQPNPEGLGVSKFITMMTLAMAPCYAPNLNQPTILGDLFFDLKTGKINEEIWQKYLAWDPLRMVDRYQENLKRLQWIHLDSGKQDEYGMQLGHRQIAAKLDKFGIPCYLNEYDGGHMGNGWRNSERIQLMLEKMLMS